MIGSGELIVILCVILVLFGGKKLPEFARNLGRGFHEFKKACQGIESDPTESSFPPSDTIDATSKPAPESKELSNDRS